MIRRKRRERVFCLFFIISIFISLSSCETGKTPVVPEPSPGDIQTLSPGREFPIRFEEESILVNGRENRVFTLTIDLRDERVRVEPYLSFGRVYGFERLSEMAERTQAYAAVTAGFFHMFGRPAGLFVLDGRLISRGTGISPSLLIGQGRAWFEKQETRVYVVHEGKRIPVGGINEPVEGILPSVVYTPEYGTYDRWDFPHMAVRVERGMITGISMESGEVPIPREGFLLSYLDGESFNFSMGQRLELEVSPSYGEGMSGYQASGMLLENGVPVVGDTDPWIGTLNVWDPRTSVGLVDEHTLVFMVVDGRQEGYSSGVTARELAGLLLDKGVRDAMILDGGSSAQMIVRGEVVNRPSFRNEERPLAGGFMIHVD
ncbi:MAG: phosphodiester glycosidase family protein [Clostridia bacterium]